MPRVSVIIPVFNGATFVGQAIESVLGQTFTDTEILVVNDGSTDNTAEVVKRYEPRVTYLFHENRGMSASRNRAIAQSAGEFIAFLDCDDTWEPEKLQEQVEILDAKPEVGIVYTDLRVNYSDGTELRSFLASRPTAGDGFVRDALLRNCFILPSTVLLRKRCLEEFGVFDETLRSHEDYELWARICGRWQVALLRKPLTNRRQGTHNVTGQTGPRVSHGVRAIEKIAGMPDLTARQRAIVQGELARAYFHRAYFEYTTNAMPACRASLRSSLRLRFWNPAAWRCYGLSLLPTGVLRRLRGLRTA